MAKTASISAAAKELCVSQPAVSQAVKSLEQAIGINLFIRTKKGVSLTGAGELLYKHVAEGYEAISMFGFCGRGVVTIPKSMLFANKWSIVLGVGAFVTCTLMPG